MKTCIALVVAALAVTGCGSEPADDGPPAAGAATPERAEINSDKAPRTLTCGDLADKAASAAVGRRAQFALAAEADVKGMSRLRVAQSIFFAMTELCRDADAGYRPAADAVRAVEQGKYRADLASP
jgi:hypothetical protein